MITLLFVVFAGNIINSTQIPLAFAWIQYLSPCAYAYKALMQNEFRGLQFSCSTDSSVPNSIQNPVCFNTGEQVLNYFGMATFEIWQSLILLALLAAVFHLAAMGILHLKTKPPKLIQ